ncbi:MAG: diacylglycerol/polyprenol kinase family protein [Bacteriovoracia bacterium]
MLSRLSRSIPRALEKAISPRIFLSTQVRLSQLTRDLPARNELHIARKLWHISTGLIIVTCYMSGLSQSVGIQILSYLLAFSITMEFLRLKNPAVNETCVRFFSPIIRRHEVNKISGTPYYVASSLVAIAVFPKPVAILSLLYLALGDPISSFFGVLYSKKSVRIFEGKSLHGTVAGFIACSLVTWIYLRSTGMYGLNLIRLSLLGGFAGALAELLPLEVDDNFTIPVVSGFIMWIGFIVIHFV